MDRVAEDPAAGAPADGRPSGDCARDGAAGRCVRGALRLLVASGRESPRRRPWDPIDPPIRDRVLGAYTLDEDPTPRRTCGACPEAVGLARVAALLAETAPTRVRAPVEP